jgi:hypothetical protein
MQPEPTRHYYTGFTIVQKDLANQCFGSALTLCGSGSSFSNECGSGSWIYVKNKNFVKVKNYVKF